MCAFMCMCLNDAKDSRTVHSEVVYSEVQGIVLSVHACACACACMHACVHVCAARGALCYMNMYNVGL